MLGYIAPLGGWPGWLSRDHEVFTTPLRTHRTPALRRQAFCWLSCVTVVLDDGHSVRLPRLLDTRCARVRRGVCADRSVHPEREDIL